MSLCEQTWWLLMWVSHTRGRWRSSICRISLFYEFFLGVVGSQGLQAVDLSVIWPAKGPSFCGSDPGSWYLRKTRSHLALSGGAPESD